MTTTRAPEIGVLLADRYELQRLLARGGMADVFEAQDRVLDRRVAVKVLRALGDERSRRRFQKEATTLAALTHPGLVEVYDAGADDDHAWVVLELVEGPTLRAVLDDRGTVPSEEVAGIGAAVAGALAHVHERGVVHRDVTPSNLLCDQDGRPRLADFGIARLVDATALTATATTVGTVAYMAPEQVQGRAVTPAADVYALGLVLLELLTGARAFDGPSHEAAVARLVRNPDVSGAPAEWRELLGAMTERAPGNRPTAAEVQARCAALASRASWADDAVTAAPSVAVVAPGVDPAAVAPTAATVADVPAVEEAPAGGTTVLPVPLRPVEPTRPRGRALAVAAIVVVVLLALAAVADRGARDLVPASATSTTEAPPSTTVTTEAPAVTAPPTTAAPEAPAGKDPGKGPGKGKGRGEKGDD